MRKLAYGFTLLELIATLAITALLLVMAAPTFSTLTTRAHFAGLTGQLLAGFNYARSEAIRTNQIVYACALNAKSNLDIQGCSHLKRSKEFVWDEGLLLYADLPHGSPSQYDTREALRHTLFREQISVSAKTKQLAFNAEGRTHNGQEYVFLLRDRNNEMCRTIHLSASGKARACSHGEAHCDAC